MAVTISGASGTWSHGQSVTISGSGFGANSAEQEWTGASIEAGTVGQSFLGNRTRWTRQQDWSPVLYASDQTHSGSRSGKVTVDSGSNWNGTLTFQPANPIVAGGDTCYLSWWTRAQNSGTGQWKMVRFMNQNGISDYAPDLQNQNDVPQIVLFNWVTGGSPDGNQCVFNPGYGGTFEQSLYPPTSCFPPMNGTWHRMEVILKTSAVDSFNGSIVIGKYSGAAYNSWSYAPETQISAKSGAYNYIVFQNYLGNGLPSGPIWFDDIYFSKSWARVELTDSATWAARKTSEIQPWTSWADGSITINANTLALSAGQTRYLYVIDSAGLVNANGLPVTIGSGGGAVVPVADFSASAVAGQAPLAVSFTDMSTNTPTSWAWNFGANASPATSTAQNPSTTYAYGGSKTVALTATNSAGSNLVTKTNYVAVRYLKPTNLQVT